MTPVTIDWDAVELLPRRICCVCAKFAIPWGRSLDDKFFCSKRCAEQREVPNPEDVAFDVAAGYSWMARARRRSVRAGHGAERPPAWSAGPVAVGG